MYLGGWKSDIQKQSPGKTRSLAEAQATSTNQQATTRYSFCPAMPRKT